MVENLLFKGTPFLADNELFVISHDERTEYTYFSTYTRGISKTITAVGNSAMIINTTQCSSMTISNSKSNSMVAMGMASDRTVTLIGYNSSFSNVNISAYDYVTISGSGNYTLTLS